MSELCRMHGISRPTGYAVVRRYAADGHAGLEARSHAPERHPNQTADSIEQLVLGLRRAHPLWGPRPLKKVLEDRNPELMIPAASTIGTILDREGLTRHRPKRRRVAPWQQPFASVEAPNDEWACDFKGWIRTTDGERVDPLTISDSLSRFLLRCQAVEKTDTERVQAIFEAAFREYGMPWAVRSDNGPPFASCALAGLSRLAVWWIKLGIVPERIEAGHPEQNGRHERMHRTLKQDVPTAQDWRSQQRELDRFLHDFNQVRPHEALDMQTPASVYEPSPRTYPARIPEVKYPDTMELRTVKTHGHFRWKKKDIFLTEVLWGEPIGLMPLGEGLFNIYFADRPLIGFDSTRDKIVPLTNPNWPKDKNKKPS